MGVVGLGIDLIEVEAFRAIYDDPLTDLSEMFTSAELQEVGDPPNFTRLAARMAAKEAALKALGCGLQDGISLTDIAVCNDHLGKPGLHTSGGAKITADALGITSWRVSLTHTEATAAAVAIALSGPI